jgi:6-phosphogluconolactonase
MKHLLSVGLFALLFTTDLSAAMHHFYVGTYTRGESKGIYHGTLDTHTGEIAIGGVAAETVSPSFLKRHPTGPFLYAVNETATGDISAFRIDPKTRELTLINQQSTHGGAPCHLSIDATGRHVITANYSGGNLCMLPINKDGSLTEAEKIIQHTGSSVNPKRQQSPHAHSIDFSPDNRFALSCDLGIDQVLVYRYDAETSSLMPHNPAYLNIEAGSGPRHLAFHPDGKRIYVLNEISSTLAACTWDATQGTVSAVKTVSTLPGDFKGRSGTAEVAVHPNGKFVYASNRGHDSMVVFSATLELIEHESTQGKAPRHFCIDPSGHFLLAANQGSDSIFSFAIDQDTGKLTPTGHRVTVPMPVCIAFE